MGPAEATCTFQEDHLGTCEKLQGRSIFLLSLRPTAKAVKGGQRTPWDSRYVEPQLGALGGNSERPRCNKKKLDWIQVTNYFAAISHLMCCPKMYLMFVKFYSYYLQLC